MKVPLSTLKAGLLPHRQGHPPHPAIVLALGDRLRPLRALVQKAFACMAASAGMYPRLRSVHDTRPLFPAQSHHHLFRPRHLECIEATRCPQSAPRGLGVPASLLQSKSALKRLRALSRLPCLQMLLMFLRMLPHSRRWSCLYERRKPHRRSHPQRSKYQPHSLPIRNCHRHNVRRPCHRTRSRCRSHTNLSPNREWLCNRQSLHRIDPQLHLPPTTCQAGSLCRLRASSHRVSPLLRTSSPSRPRTCYLQGPLLQDHVVLSVVLITRQRVSGQSSWKGLLTQVRQLR